MTHKELIERILSDLNMTPYKLHKTTGISQNSINLWRKGGKIQAGAIFHLKYFYDKKYPNNELFKQFIIDITPK